MGRRGTDCEGGRGRGKEGGGGEKKGERGDRWGRGEGRRGGGGWGGRGGERGGGAPVVGDAEEECSSVWVPVPNWFLVLLFLKLCSTLS